VKCVFLRERARYINGREIIRRAPDGAVQCFSDASRLGYGAYIITSTVLTVQGRWTAIECQRSSTWRELAAVVRSLERFQQVIAGRPLQWHCDNAAAVQILECGSSKVHLQLLALRVTEVCLRNRNKFFPVWIPRGDNTTADDPVAQV
jgi:hypothetical protein